MNKTVDKDDPVARAKAKLAQVSCIFCNFSQFFIKFFESDIIENEKGRSKLAKNIKAQKEADKKVENRGFKSVCLKLYV